MNTIKVVMVEPEIPGNTGNIMRLCASTGSELHLIGPLGFFLDNRLMHRAGLDYKEFCVFRKHVNWDNYQLVGITTNLVWMAAIAGGGVSQGGGSMGVSGGAWQGIYL